MTSTRVSPHAVALVAVVAFACFSTTQFNTNEVKAKPGTAVTAGGERPSFGPYQPSSLEQYLVDNAVALGFDKTGDGEEMASLSQFRISGLSLRMVRQTAIKFAISLNSILD
jgi:hypothetical protein